MTKPRLRMNNDHTAIFMNIIVLVVTILFGCLLTSVPVESAHALKKLQSTSITMSISPLPGSKFGQPNPKYVTVGARYMIAGVLTSQVNPSLPLNGKNVILTGNSPMITGSAITNEAGRYIFEPVAPNMPGQYKVIVTFNSEIPCSVPPCYSGSSANSILTVMPSIAESQQR
jgi:hypothetical protein